MRKGVCKNGHILTEKDVNPTHGRSMCRTCQRRTLSIYNKEREWNKEHGLPTMRRLPVGPFAGWLRENMPEENITSWAKKAGFDDANLRRILRGTQKTVTIDVVDKAVQAYGEPWELEEMYPLEEVTS